MAFPAFFARAPTLRQRFAGAWQDRVRRMLVGHADDAARVCARPIP